MVETPYALTKYVAAKNQTFNDDEQEDCDFLFNIETFTSFENRVEMAKIASSKGGVQGMVFGRVDYSGSIDLGREGINDDRVTNDVIAVAEVCKASKLDLVVGGGVSADSIACLRKIRAVHLKRIETRKVVFGAAALDSDSIEAGLLNAVHFELLWLMNKRDYYGSIEREDAKRIEMLDARWKVLNKK
jgi:copper homeostasis protein CutC